LNTEVSKINFINDQIVITTNKGKFTAEKVIITLPLGVLKKGSIKFEPDLPSFKTLALEKLKMGILDSIVLKFPKVFWPKDTVGFAIANETIDFSFFMNLYYFHQQPILTVRTAGEHALKLEHLDDKSLVNLVMQDLRKIFGNHIPEPQQHL